MADHDHDHDKTAEAAQVRADQRKAAALTAIDGLCSAIHDLRSTGHRADATAAERAQDALNAVVVANPAMAEYAVNTLKRAS